MQLDQLITSRFSVRTFNNDKVDKSIILEILEAAHMAPSAVNYQPWHFIVISEKEDLNSLHEVYHREWFKEAPVCIVVCADHSLSWKRKSDGKDFGDVDAAIAIDHLVLKATDLGLGTCWVCNFNVELTRQKLDIPDHIEPIAIIPIGYTTSRAPGKLRKDLSEMIHWGKFKAI
jgi:nitroreductase